MTGRTPRLIRRSTRQHGSGAPWVLGWVAGIAVLTVFCAERHIPILEQAMLADVQAAVGPIATLPVVATVEGYTASLRGDISSADEGRRLLQAAAAVDGIRQVDNRLVLVASTDDTAPVTAAAIDAPATANTPQTTASPATTDSPAAADTLPPADLPGESPTGDASPATPDLAGQAGDTTAPPEPDAPADTPTDAPAAGNTPTSETPGGQHTAAAPALKPAALQLSLDGSTLSVSGRVASQGALNEIMRASINAFDVDTINNRVVVDADTLDAPWLSGLAELMPAFDAVADPQIGIVAERIVLAGRLDSEAARDQLANRLEPLGMTLIDRLEVVPAAPEADEPPTAPGTPPASTETAATSTPDPAPEPTPTAAPDPSPDPSPEPVADAASEPTPEPAPEPPPEPATESAADAAPEPTREPAPEPAQEPVAEASPVSAPEPVAKASPAPAPAPEPATESVPEPAPQAAPQATPKSAPAPAEAPRAAAAPQAEATATATRSAPSGSAADYPTQRAALQKAFDALPDKRILFEIDSNRLTLDSQRILDRMAGLFSQYPGVTIAIDGHTDAAGPEDLNLALSQERANVVRDYLVRRGVSVYQLKSYGFGEGIPIADNGSAEGRARNRRIEFNF